MINEHYIFVNILNRCEAIANWKTYSYICNMFWQLQLESYSPSSEMFFYVSTSSQ